MHGEPLVEQPLLQLLLVERIQEAMQQCLRKRPEKVVVENEVGQR